MLVIVGVILSVVVAEGCRSSSTPRSSGEEELPTKMVTLKVEGMTCDACAISVKTALKGVEGVKEAKVSYEKGEAQVEYIEGKATVNQMIEAVNKIGYKASRPA